MAGFTGQISQKFGARRVVRSLIGDGPEDDGRLISIAANHLAKHCHRLAVDRGFVESDVLPIRYLGPDQDAIAIRLAQHALVVRVMRQTNEIRMEFLKPTEKNAGILISVGAATPDGCLAVHVSALEEDRFAVEKNAGTIDADVAEPNVVGQTVLPGNHFDLIELWGIGRPECEMHGLERKACCALRVSVYSRLGGELGNSDGDSGAGMGIEYVDVACNVGDPRIETRTVCPMNVVIVTELV